MFEIKFEDNLGTLEVLGFKTEENAENYIKGDMDNVSDIMLQFLEDYDTKEIPNEYGNITTEMAADDRSYWYRWIRTWKKGE